MVRKNLICDKNKTLQREDIKTKLAQQSKAERENNSAIICEKLFNDLVIIEAKTICVYCATLLEVDLSALILRLWNLQKNLLLPRVCGDELEFINYTPSTKMQLGSFGIFEPLGKVFVDLSKIDVVLTPLVAFDSCRNRLGHGKGFYDRFFAKLNKTFKIGVAFSIQQLNRIACNSYDIKLDKIVTETNIY